MVKWRGRGAWFLNKDLGSEKWKALQGKGSERDGNPAGGQRRDWEGWGFEGGRFCPPWNVTPTAVPTWKRPLPWRCRNLHMVPMKRKFTFLTHVLWRRLLGECVEALSHAISSAGSKQKPRQDAAWANLHKAQIPSPCLSDEDFYGSPSPGCGHGGLEQFSMEHKTLPDLVSTHLCNGNF